MTDREFEMLLDATPYIFMFLLGMLAHCLVDYWAFTKAEREALREHKIWK